MKAATDLSTPAAAQLHVAATDGVAEAAARLIARTTEAQGLPLQVTDAAVLRRIATVLSPAVEP